MSFLAALQFLTILPVKRDFTAEQVGRSTAWFPAAGVIVGITLAALSYVLGLVMPFAVVNVLLVAAMVLLSGGLHLDGMVDTCDGIAGHGTPEERWAVMHDSRAGGFGVIGAALILLVKFVSLNSVPPGLMLFTLLAAPVISRWTMVYAVYAHPYARPSGLGKAFKEATRWPQSLMATIIAGAVVGGLFRLAGLAITLAVWILAAMAAYYLRRKFAGLTGDTYGAINEIAECGVFIAVSALAFKGWLV